jgi:hypothetical protein
VAALDAWLRFEDEAGFSMTPPTARTWARRGRTPLIRVRGRSQRRFSVPALACYKHGERSRLIYRPKRHLDHKRGGRRSFTWTDYRDPLIAAHQQLGAPIVLVWDNLNVHKDRRLREFIDTHDWITCYFLPALLPAGLRTRPQPRRGHLVPAAAQQPGQHRLQLLWPQPHNPCPRSRVKAPARSPKLCRWP